MGRQGTLAYWLVHMLPFVTGRLDAEGGNLKSDGFYANARAGAGNPEQAYVDTEFGRLRRGSLPGTLMADAILDSDEPVRAMIVVAGNRCCRSPARSGCARRSSSSSCSSSSTSTPAPRPSWPTSCCRARTCTSATT
jgi:hypothetical protein